MEIGPYYYEDGIAIYNGDCLEIMPRFADWRFDLVLTDPPYGITACEWDTMPDLDKLWEILKPLGKDSCAYVFTASQPFTSKLVMSNLKWFKYEWVWEKNYGSNFAVARKQPFKEHENIVVFYAKQPTYNPIMQERSEAGKAFVKNCKYNKRKSEHSKMISGKANRDPLFRLPGSVKRFKKEVGLHPTQKPVALMEYLIKTYTNKSDTVFDPFMGSGTTLVAAKKLGRKAVGIEISEKYCEIAVKRLEELDRQPPLFIT